MLGEDHRHTNGLVGADFEMSPKLRVKKTGRGKWARKHEDRQAMTAEQEGKHFFKIFNKNSFYLYQVPTVYISHEI